MNRAHNKIFLIDDAVEMVKILEALLEANGYEVECAHDGVEALRKIESGYSPELIILDMDMPKMGGVSFYHKIANLQDGTAKFPVLVFTGRSNMEVVFKGLDVDGFISKPFEMDDLLKKIDMIFEKRYGSETEQRVEKELVPRESRKIVVVEEEQEAFDNLVVALVNEGYEVIAGLGRGGRVDRDADHRVSSRIRSHEPVVVLISIKSMSPLSPELQLTARVMDTCREAKARLVLFGKKDLSVDSSALKQFYEAGVDKYVNTSDPALIVQELNLMVNPS